MTEPRYFRTTLVIEVLTEREAFNGDFQELADECIDGNASGDIQVRTVEYVSGEEMARLLERQGSDPGFFGLNSDGTVNTVPTMWD